MTPEAELLANLAEWQTPAAMCLMLVMFGVGAMTVNSFR